MPHLTRRTQILLDEERHARLSAEAEGRGASIAGLIREAIDRTFPATSADRRSAAAEFLRLSGSDPLIEMGPEDMRAEILSINDRETLDQSG